MRQAVIFVSALDRISPEDVVIFLARHRLARLQNIRLQPEPAHRKCSRQTCAAVDEKLQWLSVKKRSTKAKVK